MSLDPGDPKNFILYSMMMEDRDEVRERPGCGCLTLAFGLLLFFGLTAALLRS